jgi:hypothetical protein
MSTQAINDLAVLLKELTVATDALNVKGKDLAIKEREYRAILSKSLLTGRAQGYPATLLLDICRGLDEVADARLERDIAQSQYDATRERINTLKLHARIIDGQLSRDLELAGRVT